jgi:hypothetical protein
VRGRLALLMFLLGMLAGCGSLGPRAYAVYEMRRLELDLDQAWDGMLRVLLERGYRFQVLHREAGTIETHWAVVNPDYMASVLVTQQADRYSDCGKPGLWQGFRTKEARVTAVLAPGSRGGTEVRMQVAFRTQRVSTLSLSGEQPLGPAECRSRGRLEDELILQTQVTAVKQQLDRIRRGGR